MATITLSPFALGYLTCALWSSNDESTDPGGNPLDDNYTIADIDPHCLAALVAEADAFAEAHADDIARQAKQTVCDDSVMAGHDLWLSRNGHGAGYFDGDYPQAVADRLQEAARALGEINLYVGDDGVIYASGYEPARPVLRRTISVTFETLTPDSVENGDVSGNGWVCETEQDQHHIGYGVEQDVRKCRIENAQAGCYDWTSLRAALEFCAEQDRSERDVTCGHIEYGDGSPGSCEIDVLFIGAADDSAEACELLATNHTLHVAGISKGTALRLAAVLRAQYGVRFY